VLKIYGQSVVIYHALSVLFVKSGARTGMPLSVITSRPEN
jgi:hypothetical protein